MLRRPPDAAPVPPTPCIARRLEGLCLKIYFFWANYGALTRGTAAIGFAVLVALSSACGLKVRTVWARRCARAPLTPHPCGTLRML